MRIIDILGWLSRAASVLFIAGALAWQSQLLAVMAVVSLLSLSVTMAAAQSRSPGLRRRLARD